MCNETIQPPETNGTMFLLRPSLLGVEFVWGRVCQGPSLSGAEMFWNLSEMPIVTLIPTIFFLY